MKCIIIEDEDHAALYLEKQLQACTGDIEIEARLDTVEDAVNWLMHHKTDLIFLDIQLGDGLSFEIFDHIQIYTPIIFTTSYDKYAIRAFEQNSISYLLKPIKQSDLSASLEKYRNLYPVNQPALNQQYAVLNQSYQEKFIVQSGSVMTILYAKDIAYFRLQNKRYLFIVTTDNRQYMYDSTLEVLEQRLNPAGFFRINRQFIVHRPSILQMKSLDRGRLLLMTQPESKEEMVVSIGRVKAFKEWIGQ